MNVTAIIPAAGSGTRMKADMTKPFIRILDRPMLAHTLTAFEKSDAVERVIVVLPEQLITSCREEIIDTYQFSKVEYLVPGGEQRQDSVYNGLMAVTSPCDMVVIHDAARPLVTQRLIELSIQLCAEHQAVIAAVPPKDTVKRGEEGCIVSTLDREKLWMVQTPQTFSFELILKAHRQARDEQFLGTDDAVLVERLGIPVRILKGLYENIKVTTRDDLAIAERLFQLRGEECV